MTRQLTQRTRRGRSDTRPHQRSAASGFGRSPSVAAGRNTRTSQRQAGNIRLRLRLVEHHDHGWLLLASGHPCDWSSGREGASGVEDCAPNRLKASRRATWMRSARARRNRHRHARDGTGSTQLPIETSQPWSPRLTPEGIHVVIQRVALHPAEIDRDFEFGHPAILLDPRRGSRKGTRYGTTKTVFVPGRRSLRACP